MIATRLKIIGIDYPRSGEAIAPGQSSFRLSAPFPGSGPLMEFTAVRGSPGPREGSCRS